MKTVERPAMALESFEKAYPRSSPIVTPDHYPVSTFPPCAIVYGPLREAREALSAYRAELLKVPAHSLKKRQRNDDR